MSGLIVDPSGRPVSAPSDVVEFSAKGVVVLTHFHIIAQKYNWSIRCEKCGQPVQGLNNGAEKKYMSISCGCTEYRADISEIAGRV